MSWSNVREIDLATLVYVSRSTLSVEADTPAIKEIVEIAISRNANLRVTGALLYTEIHFAQVLEGPARAIAELMSSIRRDPRHCDVTVVAEHRTTARRFPKWTMAYSGPSPYLDRHLKPLIAPRLSDPERPVLVERLITRIQRLQSAGV